MTAITTIYNKKCILSQPNWPKLKSKCHQFVFRLDVVFQFGQLERFLVTFPLSSQCFYPHIRIISLLSNKDIWGSILGSPRQFHFKVLNLAKAAQTHFSYKVMFPDSGNEDMDVSHLRSNYKRRLLSLCIHNRGGMAVLDVCHLHLSSINNLPVSIIMCTQLAASNYSTFKM